MPVTLTDYFSGKVYRNVVITDNSEDVLRCDRIGEVVSEDDMETYIIYSDYVTHELYAIKE